MIQYSNKKKHRAERVYFSLKFWVVVRYCGKLQYVVWLAMTIIIKSREKWIQANLLIYLLPCAQVSSTTPLLNSSWPFSWGMVLKKVGWVFSPVSIIITRTPTGMPISHPNVSNPLLRPSLWEITGCVKLGSNHADHNVFIAHLGTLTISRWWQCSFCAFHCKFNRLLSLIFSIRSISVIFLHGMS